MTDVSPISDTFTVKDIIHKEMMRFNIPKNPIRSLSSSRTKGCSDPILVGGNFHGALLSGGPRGRNIC